MQYHNLISVSGLSGLYQLIGTKADGAIVKSVEDNTTKFISSRLHQFSHIEGIEVYTIRENTNLIEVFKKMKESLVELPNEKDAKAVKTYFQQVYPDLDFERVYNSDMKKMVKWFAIISKLNIELKLSEETAEATEADSK